MLPACRSASPTRTGAPPEGMMGDVIKGGAPARHAGSTLADPTSLNLQVCGIANAKTAPQVKERR